MSVAVSRQPQLPSFNRPTRVHNPAPRSSPVVARGIIRLPKDVLPTQQGARQARPRQRRLPKSSPVDTKVAENAVEKEDDPTMFYPMNGHSTTPKRPFRDPPSSRKPMTASTPPRSVSQSTTTRAKQSSQAEVTTTVDTSDSDAPHTRVIRELPSTPASNNSKKHPTSSPSTPESNGNINNKEQHQNNGGKNPKSRRTRPKSNPMPATAVLSMPAPGGGRDPRAPIPGQFMSRSVPSIGSAGSALPEWDMPASFSSGTDPFVVDPDEPVVKPTRVSRSESPDAPPIVPWLEIQEDHVYPMAPSSISAVSNTKSQSTPNILLTSQHQSSPSSHSLPRRGSGRQTNRHARTVSVPSLSTLPYVQREQQPSSPTSPKVADGNQVKYAGGRFQSAPAPTFLPMPSFAI